jgi:hypothetical protein
MFRSKSQSNHAGWNPAQRRESLQKPQWQRHPAKLYFLAQCRTNKAFVSENLRSLSHIRRKLAAALHFI